MHNKLFIFMMFFFQNLVNTFSVTVDNQVPKINQLEGDVINLTEDMDNLKEQVDVFSDTKTCGFHVEYCLVRNPIHQKKKTLKYIS